MIIEQKNLETTENQCLDDRKVVGKETPNLKIHHKSGHVYARSRSMHMSSHISNGCDTIVSKVVVEKYVCKFFELVKIRDLVICPCATSSHAGREAEGQT